MKLAQAAVLLAVATWMAVAAQAAPANGRSIATGLDEHATAALRGACQFLPVEGLPFPCVAHISVAARTAQPWDLQARMVSTEAVAAGDTLAVVFAMRATSGSGYVVVKLQDAGSRPLIRQTVSTGTEWQRVVLPVTTTNAYAAGALAMAFFLGMQAQEIEIGGADVLNFGQGTPAATVAVPALAAFAPASLATPATAAAEPAVSAIPAAANSPFQLPVLPPITTTTPRFVMLKLDDLKALPGGVHPRFKRVADYLAQQKLKSGFGVIVNSFETGSDSSFAWIRERAIENGGLIEFWHHGYDHAMNMDIDGTRCIAEFSGPSRTYQSEHFTKACNLMTDKTGLAFHTFGSAGNATDATGAKVLDEHPDIKVWLYGDSKANTSKFVLKRTFNLEDRVGHVSFDAFLKTYVGQRNSAYVVLQGHPGGWSDESFVNFQCVVQLLVADQWVFTTPYEFYQAKTAGKSAGR